ncbi:hypothetical protein FB45DRAFT_1081583, partial [Roridomyces roridus]
DSPSSSASPRKRIFVACTECRKRKAKCINTSTEDFPNIPCDRCQMKGLRCEYISVGEQRDLPCRADAGSAINQSAYGPKIHTPPPPSIHKPSPAPGSLVPHPLPRSTPFPIPSMPGGTIHPGQLYNYPGMSPQYPNIHVPPPYPSGHPQRPHPASRHLGDRRDSSSDGNPQRNDLLLSQLNPNISALGKRQSMLIGMLVKEFQECTTF